MGLGDLIREAKQVRTLKQTYDRLKEARMKGNLKTAAFAVLSAVATAVVAHVTSACPGLTTQWGAILTAAIGAAATYLVTRPKENTAAKSVATGGVGVIAASIAQQLNTLCGADFLHTLPTVITAGAFIGLGLYLKSPHDPVA